MEISLIGEYAGKVWKALDEQGEQEMTHLKKSTALGEKEISAAIGWLAREDKVQAVEGKKGRRKTVLFSLKR